IGAQVPFFHLGFDHNPTAVGELLPAGGWFSIGEHRGCGLYSNVRIVLLLNVVMNFSVDKVFAIFDADILETQPTVLDADDRGRARASPSPRRRPRAHAGDARTGLSPSR